jgi:hypothetical protein
LSSFDYTVMPSLCFGCHIRLRLAEYGDSTSVPRPEPRS